MFFVDKFTDQDAARQKQVTDYALAQGANAVTNSNVDGTCGWWLRSPHTNGSESVREVRENGNASYNTYVYYTNVGVVPALQIIL